MQADAPVAIDLEQEPEHVKAMYGMDQKETEVYGRQCLLARRLVERERRECVEQGYLLLPLVFQHEASGDLDAAIALDAEAGSLHQGERFPLARPDANHVPGRQLLERDDVVRVWIPVIEASDRTGVVALSLPTADEATLTACEDLGLLAGYLIAAPLFIAVALLLFSVRSWPMIVGVSIGFTVPVFLVFVEFLNVRLPTGILDMPLRSLGLV